MCRAPGPPSGRLGANTQPQERHLSPRRPSVYTRLVLPAAGSTPDSFFLPASGGCSQSPPSRTEEGTRNTAPRQGHTAWPCSQPEGTPSGTRPFYRVVEGAPQFKHGSLVSLLSSAALDISEWPLPVISG